MADNYRQFSTVVPLRNEAELSWAREIIALLDRWENGGAPQEAPDPDNLIESLIDSDFLGFEIQVSDGDLWIYADQCGTPENVVPIVQAYLRRFDPQGCYAFEWATTCSKMRPDEFSGGAVFITATTDEWMTASQWTADKIAAHQSARTDSSKADPAPSAYADFGADTDEVSLCELIDLASHTIAGYHAWSKWLENYHDPAKSALVDLLAEFAPTTNTVSKDSAEDGHG